MSVPKTINHLSHILLNTYLYFCFGTICSYAQVIPGSALIQESFQAVLRVPYGNLGIEPGSARQTPSSPLCYHSGLSIHILTFTKEI